MSGRVRLTNAIRGDLRFLRLLLSVAYWTALDEPVKSSTFFCILEHPSREAAAANWKALQDDSERKTVKAKSEEHGKLVEKIDSTFLPPTDFPAITDLRSADRLISMNEDAAVTNDQCGRPHPRGAPLRLLGLLLPGRAQRQRCL